MGSGDGSLFTDVVDEGVAVSVLLVDVMVFALFFFPVIFVRREEGVGLGGGVVDLRETKTVGEGEGLTVDGGSADDVDILVGGAVGKSLFEGGVDIAARVEGGTLAVVQTPSNSP